MPVFLHCYDGDTCRFQNGPSVVNVRFWGIDTPELKQEGGKAAQRQTEALLRNRTIELYCKGKSYKRAVCQVVADGQYINQILVQQGFAWDSPKHSGGEFADEEAIARKARLGIWRGNPTPPWAWRKQH